MSPSKAIDPALLRHAVSPTISQADYMHQQEVRSLVAGVFFDATCVLDAYMEARATRLLQFRGYASQVIQQLRSAVAIVDREHRILYANELFVSVAGVDPGLLYCMRISEVMPTADLTQVLAELDRTDKTCMTVVRKVAESTFRITLSQLEHVPAETHHNVAIVLDDVSTILKLGESVFVTNFLPSMGHTSERLIHANCFAAGSGSGYRSRRRNEPRRTRRARRKDRTEAKLAEKTINSTEVSASRGES